MREHKGYSSQRLLSIGERIGLCLIILTFCLTLSHAQPAEQIPDKQDGELIFPDKSLKALWENWKELMHQIEKPRENRQLIDKNINNLKQKCLDRGIESFEMFCVALCREGYHAYSNSNYDLAIKFFKYASILDKSQPLCYIGLANAYFAKSLFNFPKVVLYLGHAYRLVFDDIWGKIFIVADLILIGSIMLLLFCISFLIVVFVKYYKLFEHELIEKLGLRSSYHVARVIILLVLMLPLILRLGLVWMLILMLFLCWIYATRNERVVLILFLITLIAIPSLLSQAAKYYQLYNSRLLHAAVFMKKGGYSDQVLRALEYEAKQNPQEPLIFFFTALSYKRQGEKLLAAIAQYQRAYNLRSDFFEALLNMGNVYFILKEIDKAIEAYQQARMIDPEAVIVHYNLSRAYYEKLRFEEGATARSDAMRISPEMVDYYTSIYTRNINRVVIDKSIPTHILKDKMNQLLVENTVDPQLLWVEGIWGIKSESLAFLAIIVGILLFVGERYRTRYFPKARECSVCGKGICKNCLRSNRGKYYCIDCYDAFVDTSTVKYDLKEKRKKLINRMDIIRNGGLLGFNLLFPGAGLIIKGRVIWGQVFLLLWSLFIIILLKHNLLLTMPIFIFDAWGIIKSFLMAIIFTVYCATTYLLYREM